MICDTYKYYEAVEDFLDNLRNVGASVKTIRNYSSRLHLFGSYFQENGKTEDPTYNDVKSWRNQLNDNGLKPTTVRQYLIELRSFFDYATDEALEDNRWYVKNPVSKRLLPDTKSKQPYEHILSDEDLLKLWDNHCPGNGKKTYWPRNYAIVILLLTTEIRNNELLELTPSDLDWEYSEIIVRHGKGDKYRVVDFPLIAQTAVALYLKSGIRPQTASDDECLFGTFAEQSFQGRGNGENWHKGTSQWLSSLVERHIKMITGVEDIRTHALRHAGARLDLNCGMRAEALQAKLGHESLTTTRIYSGRLLPSRRRTTAAEVLAERDRQAEINQQMLALMG